MVASAIVAVAMALPTNWVMVGGLYGLFAVAPIAGAAWVAYRGHRRLAAAGFLVSAIMVNALYTWICVAPTLFVLPGLLCAWIFLFGPVIFAFGAAWTSLATKTTAVPRRSPRMAFTATIALTLLPAFTALSVWPLHLAFALARPELERLADQAAAGQSIPFPRWAGPFRLVRAAAVADSGNVGLMIDADPSGPVGFVRSRPGASRGARDPILGTDTYVELGWGWSYRVED